MERTKVTSSNLYSVGYDAERHIMEIEFRESRGIYQYYSVSSSVYFALMNASSHGKYFCTYIKNRYRYRRIR